MTFKEFLALRFCDKGYKFSKMEKANLKGKVEVYMDPLLGVRGMGDLKYTDLGHVLLRVT
jgi:hypothetical protein